MGKLKGRLFLEVPEFQTDSWAHHLGFFINTHNNRTRNVEYIGMAGGGASGESIKVNTKGVVVGEIDDDILDFKFKCEYFLKNFDDFEKRFYEYVDSL